MLKLQSTLKVCTMLAIASFATNAYAMRPRGFDDPDARPSHQVHVQRPSPSKTPSPEDLAKQECRDAARADATRTASINSCESAKENAYNNATGRGIGQFCQSIGITDANVCIMDTGGAIEQAIATTCTNSAQPSASDVATKTTACINAKKTVAADCTQFKKDKEKAAHDQGVAAQELQKAQQDQAAADKAYREAVRNLEVNSCRQ